MPSEQVYSEIEDGNVIGKNKVSVVLVGEVENICTIVSGSGATGTSEPSQLFVYDKRASSSAQRPRSNWKKEASSSSY